MDKSDFIAGNQFVHAYLLKAGILKWLLKLEIRRMVFDLVVIWTNKTITIFFRISIKLCLYLFG